MENAVLSKQVWYEIYSLLFWLDSLNWTWKRRMLSQRRRIRTMPAKIRPVKNGLNLTEESIAVIGFSALPEQFQFSKLGKYLRP